MDFHAMLNTVILGDCFELFNRLPDNSIDLVLTDPPYNTTALDFDGEEVDLPLLWTHIKRVLKPTGAVVMTASQPFTTFAIMSNLSQFRYNLIWEKNISTGYHLANKKPMAIHEEVLVFAPGQYPYNPQMIKGKAYVKKRAAGSNYGDHLKAKTAPKRKPTINAGERYPTSILRFDRETGLHPTQKPEPLFEYLVRTYSQPGAVVLDPYGGSGTAAIAAIRSGRQFIVFEKDPVYFERAGRRVEDEYKQPKLFDILPTSPAPLAVQAGGGTLADNPPEEFPVFVPMAFSFDFKETGTD